MSTEGKVITCKAAVTWEKNQPPKIENIEVDPPKKGEVRVKIVATGVCHSDLSANNGIKKTNYPVVLGHEGGGIVESVGEGVTTVKPGDHILTTFVPQCRQCHVCRNVQNGNRCEMSPIITFSGLMADGTRRFRCKGQEIYNFNGVSTFSEYTVISEMNACKIDKNAPLETLCLLSCGFTTGYGAAIRTAKVPEGAVCAIWGLGGIGLSAVLGCKDAGAKRIICIDINSEKAEVAKQFGMTDFLNPKDYDKPIAEVLIEMTDGGVDFAFECVGQKTLVETAFASCNLAFGTCVVVGLSPHTQRVEFDPIELMVGKKIIGTWVGGWKPLDDVPKLVDAYMKGALMVDAFVTKKMPLEKLNEAYQLMIDGKVIRTVLVME